MRLDKQQIEAVVACEDTQLIMAAAGSGKTMSLLAKIEFLVDKLKYDQLQILVISFTRKTVCELRERCRYQVENQTFHSLGNKLIKFSSQSNPVQKTHLDNDEQKRIITDLIEERLRKDDVFATWFYDFFLFYYFVPRDFNELQSHSMRILYNRFFLRAPLSSDMRRKSIYKSSIGRDLIRNLDEQLIANWLFVHRIKYVYKRKIADGLSYTPTFSILRRGLTIGYLDIF